MSNPNWEQLAWARVLGVLGIHRETNAAGINEVCDMIRDLKRKAARYDHAKRVREQYEQKIFRQEEEPVSDDLDKLINQVKKLSEPTEKIYPIGMQVAWDRFENNQPTLAEDIQRIGDLISGKPEPAKLRIFNPE